jgi:hypothetical protein
MKTYPQVPMSILEGWRSGEEVHPSGEQVAFHYHDLEEWLEVLEGRISFFDLAGRESRLAAGSVFMIPRGEVHRADIGPDGVRYRMLLPVDLPDTFANRLSADEIAMLQANLLFPVREDNLAGEAAQFFGEHLSEALTFCRANGDVVGKDAFRGAFTNRSRRSSGTVQILNRTPSAILLSTIVSVGVDGPDPTHFTNIRLFAKEGDAWKCRIWVNYPAIFD